MICLGPFGVVFGLFYVSLTSCCDNLWLSWFGLAWIACGWMINATRNLHLSGYQGPIYIAKTPAQPKTVWKQLFRSISQNLHTASPSSLPSLEKYLRNNRHSCQMNGNSIKSLKSLHFDFAFGVLQIIFRHNDLERRLWVREEADEHWTDKSELSVSL